MDMSKVECANCNKKIPIESAWNIQLGTEYRPFCSKDCAMELIENHISEQSQIINYLIQKLSEIRKYG